MLSLKLIMLQMNPFSMWYTVHKLALCEKVLTVRGEVDKYVHGIHEQMAVNNIVGNNSFIGVSDWMP